MRAPGQVAGVAFGKAGLSTLTAQSRIVNSCAAPLQASGAGCRWRSYGRCIGHWTALGAETHRARIAIGQSRPPIVVSRGGERRAWGGAFGLRPVRRGRAPAIASTPFDRLCLTVATVGTELVLI
jgi:hypothetical protein